MRHESVFEFSFSAPRTAVGGSDIATLTPKERAVVELVAQGMTNKQVAREMGGMSPHTVATHLRRSFVKLQVNSREQLADVMKGAAEVG